MKKPKIQVVVGLIIIFFLSIMLAAQVRKAKESNLSILPALSNEQHSSKSEEAEFVFEEKYTNFEYGFSFEYPREWSIDTENIDFSLDESLGAEELIYLQTDAREGLVYGNSLSIVVTNLSFSDIADNIEESERLPSGETLTEFYDIERIVFDNVIAKYGLHGTAIGIPTEFYYIPLYKNKGLYIHAPHQELTTDEIRQIVSTIEVTPDFIQTNSNGSAAPASWPRHSFEELGFSIQLPFAAEEIESNSIECGPESICNTLGYKFAASLEDYNNHFLTAISYGWSPARERLPGEITGYKQGGDRYFEMIEDSTSSEIFPLQFVHADGLDVLIYDSADSRRFGYIPRHSAVRGKEYIALIPVESTDRYEMAVLQLNVEELSYDDFVLAVQSIQQISDSVETVAVGETLRVDQETLSDRQLLWLRNEYMNDLISVEYTNVPDYERTFHGGVEVASNESVVSVKRTAMELQGYLLYAPATGQRAEFVGTMGEFNTTGEYFATCNVSALSGYSASVYETSTLEQVYELSSIDLSRIKSCEVNDDIFTIDYLDIDKQEKQSIVELSEGASADAIDIPSDWLTYENEEYGFRIQYPPEYSISNTENLVLVFDEKLRYTGDSSIWNLFIIDRSKYQLEELIEASESENNDKEAIREEIKFKNGRNTTILTVIDVETKEWISKKVYVELNNYILAIGHEPGEKDYFEIFYNSLEVF